MLSAVFVPAASHVSKTKFDFEKRCEFFVLGAERRWQGTVVFLGP